MKYIEELKKKGFETKIICDFLIGETERRKLTIDEREYLSDYIMTLERRIQNFKAINKQKK